MNQTKPKNKKTEKWDWGSQTYSMIGVALALVITGLWKLVDFLQFGRDTPSISDTIVLIVLVLSILLNIKMVRMWEHRKNTGKKPPVKEPKRTAPKANGKIVPFKRK